MSDPSAYVNVSDVPPVRKVHGHLVSDDAEAATVTDALTRYSAAVRAAQSRGRRDSKGTAHAPVAGPGRAVPLVAEADLI